MSCEVRHDLSTVGFNLRHQLVGRGDRPEDELAAPDRDIRANFLDALFWCADSAAGWQGFRRQGKALEKLLRDLLRTGTVMTDMGQEQHAGLARVDRAAVLCSIGSELVHASLKLLGRDKGGKPAIAIPGGALDRQVALAADPDVERPFSRARFESDVGELIEPPF